MPENELIALIEEYEYRLKYDKLCTYYFQETAEDDISNPRSSWSRKHFPKHLEFFSKGAQYRMRWASAANRTSKTVSAMYELVLHATGLYPDWWNGRRVSTCDNYLVMGRTQKSTRDVLMRELLGSDPADFGTGMVPRDCIDFETLKAAKRADTLIDTIKVKHVSGGYSTLLLRSCEQSVLSLAGLNAHAFIDEPPPLDIYTEVIMRSMQGAKMVVVSATPIYGLDETLMTFIGGEEWRTGEVSQDRWVSSWSWEAVPFLTANDREALLQAIPPHARKVRAEGIPAFESGLVYPVDHSQVIINPIQIPDHWKYLNGLDVGFRVTAAQIARYDTDNDIIYITDERHFEEQALAQWCPLFASNYKDYPLVVDSAANMRSQSTGESIRNQLEEYGLATHNPVGGKSVDGDIYKVLDRFVTGRLKIFATCTHTIRELRKYQRDEKGKVIKADDHHMDALRYLVQSIELAETDMQNKMNKHNHFAQRRW